MPETKVPKSNLAPLRINDADVDTISLAKIDRSGASENQTITWSGSAWEPTSLPTGQTFVDNEIPSGLKNGVNKDFTLQHLPNPPASLQLFKGGILLLQGTGNDYTINNKIITLAIAPDVNDVLVAYYRR